MDNIRQIALKTFEITCYMFPLEEWELEDYEQDARQKASIKAVVEFEGASEGAMVIAPSQNLLENIAANMLGTDETDQSQREGALGEIANIICGNAAPLFSDSEEICYIVPPRIFEIGENTDRLYEGMSKQSLELKFDEGEAEILIYLKQMVSS